LLLLYLKTYMVPHKTPFQGTNRPVGLFCLFGLVDLTAIVPTVSHTMYTRELTSIRSRASDDGCEIASQIWKGPDYMFIQFILTNLLWLHAHLSFSGVGCMNIWKGIYTGTMLLKSKWYAVGVHPGIG
jgi:hypothetical protein